MSHVQERVFAHRGAFRSVAALFGSNMLSSILGVAGGLIGARFLGPEVTGPFRSYTIPLMYLVFLHLGTFDGLWRQIPFYTGQNRPAKVEALSSSAGAWNMMVSAIVSLGFVLCAIYSLGHGDLYGMAGWLSQVIACWGILYGGYVGATYRTLNHFVALARVQLWQAVANFVLVFVLPLFQFYGLCLRAAGSAFVGVWLMHRKRPLKMPYRLTREPLIEVIRIGFPLSFWGSINTSFWTAAENSLMLMLGGFTELGLFSIAAVLREAISVLPQAVNQVIMPRIVEGFGRDGSVRSANARTFLPTVGLTMFMTVVVVAIAFSLDILVPLAIPKYTAGIPLMKACLWFGVVQTAALPLNAIFATGKPWVFGRGILLGLVVFPISAYLLAPSIGGVLAVAWGSLLGRAVRIVEAYAEIYLLIHQERGTTL
jgi:O-antigen/teichoic acid export membrane protein